MRLRIGVVLYLGLVFLGKIGRNYISTIILFQATLEEITLQATKKAQWIIIKRAENRIKDR